MAVSQKRGPVNWCYEAVMANMLRPWLAPLLHQEIQAALAWRRGQLKKAEMPSIKAERDDDDEVMSDLDSQADLLYSDDGSNFRIDVTRELSSGHNSYLQIVQVQSRQIVRHIRHADLLVVHHIR